MAAKYQLITELYRRTGVSVAKSPQAWQSFLSSACRNYKCRFDEQLLIYAQVENRLLGVETNITNWQRKQNQNNNFSAVIPYDLEQQRKESKEFLDDLTTRDQRMMFAVLTMVHTAETKEQLDNDTEALLTTARKHLCQFAVLKYQQMDGLNTALPFGVRKIDALRTLTTESLYRLMTTKFGEV